MLIKVYKDIRTVAGGTIMLRLVAPFFIRMITVLIYTRGKEWLL